ncbi:MAG: matrixin family metalloprotease [Candidatus Pacearchaeota archaeon]
MKNYIFFIFLLIIISSGYFFLKLNFFTEPKKLEVNKTQINYNNQISSYENELQICQNTKFNHNNITYSIDSNCKENKIKRIEEAFKIIEKEVGEIKFIRVNSDADIDVICQNIKIPTETKGYFIAGEGGPTSLINTSLFCIIEKGKVLLYKEKDYCDYPNVELHEILHVFGFGHSDNERSIMFNTSFCNQILTKDIIDEMKRLYSIKNLPELYFEDVEIKKHGLYIDFNLKIKNSGLIEAKNVSLLIKEYPSYKKIDSFELSDIEYGAGKSINVENLRIPLKTKKLIFEIFSIQEEIDKENNFLEVEL